MNENLLKSEVNIAPLHAAVICCTGLILNLGSLISTLRASTRFDIFIKLVQFHKKQGVLYSKFYSPTITHFSVHFLMHDIKFPHRLDHVCLYSIARIVFCQF